MVDNKLDDVKTDAHTIGLFCPSIRRSKKFGEHFVFLFFRNADSVVRNNNGNSGFFYFLRADRLAGINIFDVNRDFQEPMQKLLEVAAGDHGRTSIGGSNLNAEVLEDLARSTAATGNDADARVQLTAEQKPVRKRLRGNPASLVEERVESLQEKRGVLDMLRSLYLRIRRLDRDSQR